MDLYLVRNLLGSGKTIYDINLKVTFYARVSTDKDEQLNSLNNQIGYYKEFINKCPNWTYVEGYYDEGITGTSALKRENFLRMILDGKKGMFDLIITKEISRFSRSTLDSIKYTQELLASGIGVFFQNDNINTLHSDSELRLTIMSSIAQDEVRKLSERVKFGFRRSIADGRVLGNDNIYGYTKKGGKLIIEPNEAKIVEKIFELYLTGIGLRAIGKKLLENGITNRSGKEFGYSTIKRIIQNPKYKGFYCGNKSHKVAYNLDTVKKLDQSEWVIFKDEENVPPIIVTAVWERANAIYQKRSQEVKAKETSYSNKFVYSRKIFCKNHQVAYYHATYKYKSGNKHIWQCKRYSEKGLEGCTMPVIYQDELDEIMRQLINFTVNTDKTNIIDDVLVLLNEEQVQNNLIDRLNSLETQIIDTKKRKDKLLDLSINGIISDNEFKSRNTRFNTEIEMLENKMDAIHSSINKNKIALSSIEKMREIINQELDSNIIITAELVESFIEKITVLEGSTKECINLEIKSKLFSRPINVNVNRTKTNVKIELSNLCAVTSFCSS